VGLGLIGAGRGERGLTQPRGEPNRGQSDDRESFSYEKADKALGVEGLSLRQARENRWAERESNPHSQRRLIYR
jgi:hypothetical protein